MLFEQNATPWHACLRGGGGGGIGAEVAGLGDEGGDVTVSSEEPFAIEDISDNSIGDGELVFRDRETQDEWQQFVERGISPAPVKGRPGGSHQLPCMHPLKNSPTPDLSKDAPAGGPGAGDSGVLSRQEPTALR